MTQGFMLFAAVSTAYICLAVKCLEERDPVTTIGAHFEAYRHEVGMLIPGMGRKAGAPPGRSPQSAG